jgi:hypothetical protein
MRQKRRDRKERQLTSSLHTKERKNPLGKFFQNFRLKSDNLQNKIYYDKLDLKAKTK